MDSARLLGADTVIVIDKEPYRLEMAAQAGYTPLNFEDIDVRSALLELTGGRGPDKCIDAVGMEATHGSLPVYAYDRAKQATRAESERPYAAASRRRRGRCGHRHGRVRAAAGDARRLLRARPGVSRAPGTGRGPLSWAERPARRARWPVHTG